MEIRGPSGYLVKRSVYEQGKVVVVGEGRGVANVDTETKPKNNVFPMSKSSYV